MWCAYSKLLFLTILLLVEASLGRYIPCMDDNCNCDSSLHGGYVTIWWDIMNETRGSYSANVTIIDYLKNHDIDGPWALRWEWAEDEILLNTVGATGTQLGNDSSKVSKYCKGGVIPSWCTIEADLPKSSSSFQITVGRVGIEYYPPAYVDFTTPRSNFMCFSMMPFTKRRGYLSKLIDFIGISYV
ncbi:hypothetical protein BRARA_K00985 [Brassica rapa]|uniref:COBRA-like protein n=1 Tax=Brassica campestris TaxID=3711 RepID=A0A397L081_BRACM|nr:hypothetical protein BRARA_K00985 [Brassica rapa]